MSMFGTRFGRPNQLHIQSYLTALVLSCLLPVCVSTVYLVHQSYLSREALLEQNLLSMANVLSTALDRDLATHRASLEALATSPALASGDMAAFYAQTRSVLGNFPGSDIIMADATGQQIVNSYRPFGSSLPKRSNMETVSKIFETARPTISNVFKGAVTGRHLVGVDVPVFRDGRVHYDLVMTIPANHLADIFNLRELPPEWLITILDNDNAIVTRSRSPELFTGKRIDSPSLLQKMAVAHQGVTEGINAEWTLSTMAFKRSDTTGWTVLVSVPEVVMSQELRRWVWWVSAGLGVLIAFGLVLALVIARIIARSMQSLIAPALALGRGETVSVNPCEVVETNKVAKALLRADSLLREHVAAEEEAKARADAAEELAAIVEGSEHAIISKTLDGIITSWNRAAEKIYGYTAEEAIGRSISMLVPENCPDELPEILDKIARSENVEHYEATRARKDGELIQVSVSVAPIRNALGEVIGGSTIARDITERKRAEQEREKLLSELQEALANVKTLSGLLPICSYCKKIRNDEGYWQQLEAYIHQRSQAQFSHGICPDCYKRVMTELDEVEAERQVPPSKHR